MPPSNQKMKKQMRMKTKSVHIVFLFALLLWSNTSLAQANSPKDSLDTQLVKVVKPYTPKISDAFKLKHSPALDNQQTKPKEAIEYTIFSIPCTLQRLVFYTQNNDITFFAKNIQKGVVF